MKPFLALVIPIVLLFCGCGPASTPIAPTPQQAAAVKEIKKLGGHVTLNESGEVIEVSLRLAEIADTDLEHLKGLTTLSNLVLDDTPVSDAGLEHLKGLTSLDELSLIGTQVTDAGLIHLEGLTNLTTLWLYDTQITDAGLLELGDALPNCRVYK